MWGDALSTKRDEPECKHTNCPIRTHKVLLSQKHHLQDQMRQMPAILRRQHQATYTRPRKSTFKQQKIIHVQALTRMPREHQKTRK